MNDGLIRSKQSELISGEKTRIGSGIGSGIESEIPRAGIADDMIQS